jgi:SAM dependent carboxyl methyltransferase
MSARAANGSGLMTGSGYYRKHSTTQHGAAALGLPLIERAAADVPVGAAAGPIVIADFGAAQGGNSLAPMAAAIDALRARRGPLPVCVVHTDLPDNDFATLFQAVETSPESYLRERADVFPLVAGRSLYDRIFAPEQLMLGWTASTLHWLSSAPGPITDHFFVQSSSDQRARAAFADRSRRDWEVFLACRAAELAPGGGIVIVDTAVDERGGFGSEALFGALNEALRSACDSGRLTHHELERMIYPTWFRSVEELSAPFSPIYRSPSGATLQLAEVTPVVMDDPFWAALESDGDTDRYAAAQVGFLRGFLGPSFTAGLDPARADDERDAVLEAVWAAAEQLIAQDPERISPRYQLVVARLKRPGSESEL